MNREPLETWVPDDMEEAPLVRERSGGESVWYEVPSDGLQLDVHEDLLSHSLEPTDSRIRSSEPHSFEYLVNKWPQSDDADTS